MNRRLLPGAFIAVAWLSTIGYFHSSEVHGEVVPQPADDEELPIGWEQTSPASATQVVSTPAGQSTTPDGAATAFLGVTFDPQSQKAAVAMSVAAGSPAEQAGVRSGDTIEALNGRLVTGYQDVLDAVRWMKPGDSLELQVSRRVSLRTRAVLASTKSGTQHTANYRPAPIESSPDVEPQPTIAPEYLPAPTGSPRLPRAPRRSAQQAQQLEPEAPRLRILPFRADTPQPSREYGAAADRPGTDNDTPRGSAAEDGRRRGLFSRRRN